MKRYCVRASCTISLHTYVEANSPEEARALAEDHPIASVHHGGGEDEDEEWLTSGALDGEPTDFEVEEVGEAQKG